MSYDYMLAVTDANWQITGAGDYNADGKLDLVWHHATTGSNAVWYMDGITRLSYASFPALTDTDWQIVGN
ncbi:hypothetical protein [Candidatus Venteria ishoeyi]|uniref:hypothetical protein n=1 Tax=Candidatus Venteria ishoeyi TaxID=1899563 RepID=UPI0011AFEAC8|nr:hypothetical protein [Candidatus Venteria ishoeyi]